MTPQLRFTFAITLNDGSRIDARAIGINDAEALDIIMQQQAVKDFVGEHGATTRYELVGIEEIEPIANDTNRFVLTPAKQKGWWVATDTINQVLITWQEGRFNATQQVRYYADEISLTALQLATINRELSEWVVTYHKHLT